jgi:hypothetical protein
LFLPSGAVTKQNAGMVKNLTVRQNGAYSGTLMFNGGSHGISGVFNLSGQATNVVKLPAAQGGNITVNLTVDDSANPAPEVTGIVTGSGFTASLMADLATTGVKGTTNYTLLLEPDTNNNPPVASPGGDGYAAISDVNDTAHIAGALGDGTAFSQSVPVSKDGYIPVYVSSAKALLIGWINLNAGVTNSVGLTWAHPTERTGLYQSGFTDLLGVNQILISPWTNSPNLSGLTTVLTLPTVTATNVSTNLPAGISAKGKITGSGGLAGSVNLKTGIFVLTINKTPAHGAILLNNLQGGGYILSKTSSQAVLIEP